MNYAHRIRDDDNDGICREHLSNCRTIQTHTTHTSSIVANNSTAVVLTAVLGRVIEGIYWEHSDNQHWGLDPTDVYRNVRAYHTCHTAS